MPRASNASWNGWRRWEVRTARRGETLTPLALPQLGLRVDDILG